MRVADLLARDSLGLSEVWATPSMLERDVRGSYIIDLPNPGKFLSSGDLVLSGALWHTGIDSARTFISALAERGVAVLVIGRIVLGEIPDYFSEICREVGIVLLTLREDVSFKSVTQYIDSSLAGAEGQATSRSVVVGRRLLDSLGSGAGVQAALRLLFDEFGVESWVLESSGTVTALAGTSPPTDRVARVWNRMLLERGGVAVIAEPGGATSSAWPILTDGDRPIGYLVCTGDHRSWSADLSRVVGTLLVVVRVELELASSRRRAEDAQAADLVDLLVSDSLSPGEASARLRLLGSDPLEPVTVVAAAVDDEAYPPRAILEAVSSMLAGIGVSVVGSEYGTEAVLFVSGSEVTPEALIETAARSAVRYESMLGARQMRIGVSERTLSISQLGSAVASARTRMRAAAGDGPMVWAMRSTPVSYDALLDLLPEQVRARFATGLLAPLIDYDARHGSDLVETLRVFLDAGASWQNAAATLHVHVNTLRYRVGRIEALTARDLGRMADRVDLFLAVASLPGPGEGG